MKIIQIHMDKKTDSSADENYKPDLEQLGNCEQRRLMYNSEKDGISYKDILFRVIFYEK